MRRANQVTGGIFLAVGLFVLVEALDLEYWTPLGPGPGFFPFWLGFALSALAIGWFIKSTREPDEPLPEDFIPDRFGMMRVASIVGAFIVLSFLLETLGFSVTMFAFLLFLLIALGRQALPLTLVLSLLGSFGTYYVFTQYLQVQLPAASIDLLRNLGL